MEEQLVRSFASCRGPRAFADRRTGPLLVLKTITFLFRLRFQIRLISGIEHEIGIA